MIIASATYTIPTDWAVRPSQPVSPVARTGPVGRDQLNDPRFSAMMYKTAPGSERPGSERALSGQAPASMTFPSFLSSATAHALQQETGRQMSAPNQQGQKQPRAEEQGTQDKSGQRTSDNPQGLTAEEQEQVEELKKRDAEVKAHEQAHARVGGQYAGAPVYEYQQGPDNKRYAVGGHVKIDVSKEATPEETIRKMDVVKRAALAPQEPSGQDRRVASDAEQKRAEAVREQQQQKTAEITGETTGAAEDGRGQGAEAHPAPHGISAVSAAQLKRGHQVYSAANHNMATAGLALVSDLRS